MSDVDEPAPLSRRAPEARRRLVLDAARRLFLEQGFERTRMELVAAEAGVSVGLIYKYYPTKAHLLAGVREDYEARFLDIVGEDSIRRLRPRDRFKPMLEGLFAEAGRNPDLVAMLDLPSHFAGQLAEVAPRRMHVLIAAMIEDGVTKGDFRPVPPAQAAVIAYGMVEAAMRDAFSAGGGRSKDTYVDMLAEAWSRWLAA